MHASRYCLANFLVLSNHILHLNFTYCFGSENFSLASNRSLQTLSKPSNFSPSLETLHLDVYLLHLQMLYHKFFNAEEPRHFLIYHYITETAQEYTSQHFPTSTIDFAQIKFWIVLQDQHTYPIDHVHSCILVNITKQYCESRHV